MRCPRCDADALFERYSYDGNSKEYVRKIYCPVCYHREVLPVTGDEPLEDRIEFQLQLYLKGLKENIIKCFNDGKLQVHSGLTIKNDGNEVKLDFTIRQK